ncbi:MAG: hypothetical protein ACRC9L_05470 [Brevinema sp.]
MSNQNLLKIKFQEAAKPFEDKINSILLKIKELEKINILSKSSADKYRIIGSITMHLSIIEQYRLINAVYKQTFHRYSESYLELSRKRFSMIVSEAQKGFGIKISKASLDNQKELAQLKELTPNRVYKLISKINTEVNMLKDCYPATAPIREALRHLYRDLTGFSTNIINIREWYPIYQNLLDPNHKDVISIFELTIEMIESSAEIMMESYQMTKSKNSLQEALKIIEHVESIQRLIKHPGLSETTRRKETWMRLL